MENPNEDQSFKSRLGDFRTWLKPPYIETKFVEVTSALTWVNVDEAKGWRRILPIPGIDSSEIEFDPFYRQNFTSLTGPRESIESLTEKRSRRWADRSERWLLESKLIIARYKDLLRRLCQTGIDEWKAKGKTTTRTADELIKIWTKINRDKPIAWVERQLFTQERNELIIEKEIGLFVSEILQDRMENYGLNESSSPEPLPEERQLLPLNKDKKARGPYKNPRKEQTLAYYESEVRDAINKAIKAGKEPNKDKIEKPIIGRILNNKKYNERTLREHLSAEKRAVIFGEICRQVSELILLKNK